MITFDEQLLTRWWNRIAGSRAGSAPSRGLDLGQLVIDGRVSALRKTIPHHRRSQHIGILGKTGSGKSYLMRHMASEDVRSNRGFLYFDFHGDATPFLLRLIAAEERRRNEDLSERLVVIEPADPDYSVGLNILERNRSQDQLTQIAEFTQILKQRWKLDSLGARTTELLRNSLTLVADNELTLLELGLLLTDSTFRALCLKRARNPEVESYFRTRYERATESMQAVLREAILNKISEFSADTRLRHLVGQRHSTFSLAEAIDRGRWVVLNLNKARLGEQASTLGSLLLTKLKNSLFARASRELYTLYCDEIQNLVAFDSGLDTLFSESRKFGASIVSANQFLDQHPALIRAAILSAGTHIFFQLSSLDAEKMAAALDGGHSLSQRLKNLPPRHAVVKSAHHRWQQVRVADVTEPGADPSDLYNRCRRRWARPRADIEREIESRQSRYSRKSEEVLHDWE